MAAKFFTVEPKTIQIGSSGPSFKWPLVKPTEGGYIDVKNNFQWKNKITADVAEVPSLLLTEFFLPKGKWLQNLSRIFNSLSNATGETDPYGMMYEGIPTGFTYNLPYIIKPNSTITGNITNNWQEVNAFSPIEWINTQIETVEKYAELTTTGFGYEKISNFSGTNKRRITVTFPLYNTVSLEKTKDNFWFVFLFGLQNLKIRTTYLTYIPPKIYTVESATETGSIYMPVAQVQSYSVTSIGSTRAVDINVGYEDTAKYALVPEAYKVSITLEELVSNSANIMLGSVSSKDKVSIIQNPNGLTPDNMLQNNPADSWVNWAQSIIPNANQTPPGP